MRHSMKLALTFLLAATVATALANGGGYASGVKFTGSVAPFQPEGCEKVQIVKEHLDILRKLVCFFLIRVHGQPLSIP